MAGRPKRGASGSTERNGYGEFKDGSPPPARRPRGAPRGDGTRTLLQRARAAADGALQRYVDRELAVCHYVQRRRHWLPFLARVTSGHPAHDATLGVWAVAAAACAAHGYALLFTLAANLAAAYLASRLLAARCPGDVDGGLVPLGRLSPWGLPSVEVWLSTTALGWVALGALEGAHAPAERAWVVAGCVLAWLVVIVTRVYGAAYFLWQLVVSVACGGMGVYLGRHYQATLFGGMRVSMGFKLASAVVVVAALLAHVAYRAEHNGAPIGRVPKQEFMRVLGDILNGEDDEAGVGEEQAADPALRRRRPKRDGFVRLITRLEATGDADVPEGPLVPDSGDER